MIESLDAISSFYHENTVEARRCLRQDLEFQNVQLAKKFLAEFDTIRARVETVEELSGTLQGACDAVAKRVSEADENMKGFLTMQKTSLDRQKGGLGSLASGLTQNIKLLNRKSFFAIKRGIIYQYEKESSR